MAVNPFSVATTSELQRGVFAEHAALLRRNFLYRVIEVEKPFSGTLVYTGWWFRQLVEINDLACWFQISWLSIRPQFEFDLPESIDLDPNWAGRAHPTPRRVQFELQFTRGLRIRRMQIWLAGRVFYDEIN